MTRGELYQRGYRPQFSGHETFPLRYGWLKKAFDAVSQSESVPENKSIFLADDAIIRFGVGKNMVMSIRHWASSAGIFKDSWQTNRIEVTSLGRKILGKDGLDPYMEHPATLWLIHSQLCSRPESTTWYWAFNHFSEVNFDRDNLVKGLMSLAVKLNWSRVSSGTIKRDVECFVRTYTARQQSGKTINEDALESPLIELSLIRAIGKKDNFQFVRGPKASLGNGVFAYALINFWLRFSKAKTLSYETLAYEPGSPGRYFLLDENDLADRLIAMDEITKGAIRWSESAGLKQLIRRDDLDETTALDLINFDYHTITSTRCEATR